MIGPWIVVPTGMVACAGLFLWQSRLRRWAVRNWGERGDVSAAQFLSDCEIDADTHAAQIALACRTAIATLATVRTESIRASDSFSEDLSALPYWDSLDWLGFVFEVERVSGVSVRVPMDRLESAIRSAGGHQHLHVRDLVRAVVAAVA